MTYAACAPSFTCTGDMCNFLSSLSLLGESGVTPTSCEAQCCDSNLCNDAAVEIPSTGSTDTGAVTGTVVTYL